MVEEPNAPNLLWIVGAPGAGKSAVATTLVNKVFPGIWICAKVFAKRDFADRRDPSLLWRTLIYDFARQHVGLRGSIMEVVLENSLSDSSDQDELRQLLFNVISDQQDLPVVAVVDALDEGFVEDNHQWRSLLQNISSCKDFPSTFKLVVTSRDFPDIRNTLLGVSQQLVLPTGLDVSAEATSDIKAFFQMKLAGSPPYWLSGDVLPQLVAHAAGTFIWAKLVVELVKLKPNAFIQDIFNSNAHGGTGDVDFMYGKILLETLGQLPVQDRLNARRILSTIVLAKDPLHYDFMERLTSANPLEDKQHRSAKDTIKDLSSLISVDEEMHLRIPHKSFADFFLNPDRSLTAMDGLGVSAQEQCTYLLNREEDCTNLAIFCLQFLVDHLIFNAYGIPTSHVLNGEISRNIDQALVYACQFWGDHLKYTSCNDALQEKVKPLLDILLFQKVLFWLEMLSLTKAVPSARKSLRVAINLFEEYDDDLVEVANDILKFVKHFEYPITAAASHIYISALPFSPSKSRIFQIYAPQFPNLFSVSSGRREDWGNAAVTGDGHDDLIWSLSFFPSRDDPRLASTSNDKTVRIWNSKSGNALSPLSRHDTYLYCMVVSPDGRHIASGDHDGALLIWDSETGARKLYLTDAHSDIIRSVAFLPDGSRIVTGSWDGTVKVWNTTSGELCLGPLMGHTGWVNSVAFSPDGTLIASASVDKMIRIWDAPDGKSRREPLVGHTDWVCCLAFTADGHYLATGSDDKTIRVWDTTRDFMQTSSIDTESGVWSITTSPNSNLLVSGHADGSLRLWGINNGKLESLCDPIFGHTDTVQSVAFSPDGKSFASGSNDTSIKVWTVPANPKDKQGARGVGLGQSENEAFSLGQRGNPIVHDEWCIDEDGWMRDSRREDAKILFWVPEENRTGFWFPRNTAVIHKNVTKIDFSWVVHGENWAQCAKPQEVDE